MPLNLYADLDMWERRFSYEADLAYQDRQELERVLEAASRDVDRFCNRFFYAKRETLILDGSGSYILKVPDLIGINSIKLDEDRDRVYEKTLTSSDYFLVRLGHTRPYDALPKTAVVLDVVNGSVSRFLPYERLVQIDATWGFTDATEATGATVAADQSASATTLKVSAGGNFSVGQTLLVDGTEQQYVKAIAGNVLTVERGVNGTPAAQHLTGASILRYVYVPEVREATLIQAARLWKRREVAFSTREGPSPFEEFDEDAARLLWEFVRYD